MALARWCEFMRDMKDANGLTNADIAAASGVSLKTIEKIMSQSCTQDIMRETCRLIEHAIIGSSNQYPCYLAFEEANSQKVAEPDAQHKIDFLLQQVERLHRENENLWEENKRKSKIIDSLLGQQK